VGLIVGCCVVWGLGQVASKVALAQVPPLTQAGIRSLGAGILIWAWALWRGVPLRERDATLWPGLVAGALFTAEFAAIYSGLRFTTAGRMTVFLYLAPFVVAAGMTFIARSERLGRLGTIGLVTAFAGVALAFSEGFTSGAALPRQWFGDLLGISAAVLWGATTLVVRATPLAPAPAAKTLLYQLGVSGIVLTAAGLAVEPGVDWPLEPQVALSLAFQILVIGSTSYLLWFWLVRLYAAPRLSAFTLLTPVVGLFAGAWLLSEPVTPRLLVALATVCLGLAAVNRR
jgi:drug/metabolite transporter (DMT)-like permease